MVQMKKCCSYEFLGGSNSLNIPFPLIVDIFKGCKNYKFVNLIEIKYNLHLMRLTLSLSSIKQNIRRLNNIIANGS